MTPWERRNPKEIDGKRRRRIAQGSGTQREDVNKLLKMHRTMADMMKSMGGAKRGPMAGLANMFGLGGGMPQPTPEMLAELQSKMPGGLPGKMPALPPGGLPPGFPGLGGGKLPGLPGFPFGKKK
jgi:signal recognition particle subunit SRP54